MNKGISDSPVTYNTIIPECVSHFVALHSTFVEGLFILLPRDEKDEIVTGVQGSGSLWEGSDASSSGCLSLWLKYHP